MCKRCRPPSRVKSTSASLVRATCGRRCWTSTRVATDHRWVTKKTHWTSFCARPVKPRPSPSAARASVVHPALPAIQAATERTAKLAKMVKTAVPAKMPTPRTRGYPFHRNANATLLPAHPATMDPKDPTVPLASPAAQAWTVNPARKVLLAHPAHLADRANLAKKDNRAIQAVNAMAAQDLLDLPVDLEHLAPLAKLDPTARAAKTDNPEVKELPAILVHLVRRASPAPWDRPATMELLVPLARALTAHRLVWPLAIKRRFNKKFAFRIFKTAFFINHLIVNSFPIFYSSMFLN
jgi:hypothetical protein